MNMNDFYDLDYCADEMDRVLRPDIFDILDIEDRLEAISDRLLDILDANITRRFTQPVGAGLTFN